MFGVLIGLEVVISILLTIVILMQSSKGGGLAGTFGGSSVGMMFGVRRTADFLTRSTQILAAAFILLSLVINIFFLPRAGGAPSESVLQHGTPQQQGQQLPVTPQLPPQLPPSGGAEPGK